MVKSEIITLRIEPDDKALLENSAALLGLTLSDFVTRTALYEARKTRAVEIKRDRKKGVAGAYRNICEGAKAGGAANYGRAAAWILANLRKLLDDATSDGGWERKIRRLKKAGLASNPNAVLKWFEEELPDYLELIPPRRYDQFVNEVVGEVCTNGLPYQV